MSFDIALSGLNAISSELDSISNNISNSGTYGFKSSRSNFASMYADSQPLGTQIGSLTQSINKGGSVTSTGRSLDAAIQGRGFFSFRDSSGTMLYSRVGIFSVDKNGFVVDSSGRFAQGYTANISATGVATQGAFGDIQLPNGQIAAKASDTLAYVGNFSADWPTIASAFNPTDSTTYNSSVVSVVYDSLGTKHTLTQYFTKTATNTVTANYTFDGTQVGSSTLTFNSDGTLNSPTTAVSVNLGTPAGANAMTVGIDYTGTTQYTGDATTTKNSANGYASGVVSGVSIGEDGAILAQYSNGQKQTAGWLALATFPDEGALTPVSDTSWTTSTASGSALYGTPGTGMTGKLSVSSLEQSNVDVASELVSLMTAQRNYQANTKVISTESQMMQSLMQAV
jgi:flagellar hook protein FlgE